jgi:hypothetical protein
MAARYDGCWCGFCTDSIFSFLYIFETYSKKNFIRDKLRYHEDLGKFSRDQHLGYHSWRDPRTHCVNWTCFVLC